MVYYNNIIFRQESFTKVTQGIYFISSKTPVAMATIVNQSAAIHLLLETNAQSSTLPSIP